MRCQEGNVKRSQGGRETRFSGTQIALCSILTALVVLVALPAAAQVVIGDNVNLSLSGDIATGYTGGFGDTGSSHGLGLGGNATIHGSYYNPQFLTFDLQPFYNRSQSNSSYQSITNSSGIVGTASLFSGSHFPGSVSFNKTFDSSGQFGIPGVAGLETSGSGQTTSINWNALVPDWPTLRAMYIITGNDVSIPGANGTSHSNSQTLSLNSDYYLRGFQLRGYYGHGSGHSEFPGFLVGEQSGSTRSGSNQEGGSVTHAMPLRGFWTVQATHSTVNSDFGKADTGGSSDGSNTSVNASVSVNPLPKLGMGFNADYQTNAFGALQQQIVEAGGANPLRYSQDSKSEGVSGQASYSISHYVYLTGQASHREQNFLGNHFAITQYGGGVSTNFSRRLLGTLSFSVGANDTATQEGNSGASIFTNVNFGRQLLGWDVSANFNYSQAVQTVLAVYTTSMYGYGTSVKRKFGTDLFWGANFIGNHSGLERIAGSNSHGNTVSTYLHFRRYNLNALYSQTGGLSILTPQGLVSVPTGTPPPLLANALLFNAKSYGGGFGVTLRRLNVIANYSKAISTLSAPSGLLNNGSTIINARVQYRVRRMYFDSGFTRFQQSIGGSGGRPTMVNSYYAGFSRWFNVF